jgi:hypothetical protein
MADLRALRQRQRPGKFVGPPLAERIPLFLSLSRFHRLPGYAEDVMDVDRHVLLSQAGEVERRGHGIRFFVMTDVHPTLMGWLGCLFTYKGEIWLGP